MTTLYHQFIGIDIGKWEFVTNINGKNSTNTYTNNIEGFALFYQEHEAILRDALVVLEVTGGYNVLNAFLSSKGIYSISKGV